jgi:hypothetical protein
LVEERESLLKVVFGLSKQLGRVPFPIVVNFYYTNVFKIKSDARHLLLNIAVTEETPRYWKVNNWILSDLSKLSVKLKAEFNASKDDLMQEKARIISSL